MQFKPNSGACRARGNRTLNGFLCVSHKLIKPSHGYDKWYTFFRLGVSEVFSSDNVHSVSEHFSGSLQELIHVAVSDRRKPETIRFMRLTYDRQFALKRSKKPLARVPNGLFSNITFTVHKIIFSSLNGHKLLLKRFG